MPDTFHGLPTLTLENAHAKLVALREAGPRIVRLLLAGHAENLLVEMPTKNWETPFGTFNIRGGHRLWHAPEAFPRTYYPDNSGVEASVSGNRMTLRGPIEAGTGTRKSINVTLHDGRAAFTVEHTISNEGVWPVELAPWAITQLPIGGVAILPIYSPVFPATHLLPDRHIAFWPYTRAGDERITFTDNYLLIHGIVDQPPAKVGAMSRAGWIAYLRNGTLLVKRFTAQTERIHPDNCNIECYFDQYNLEIETLAPLVRLEPGQSVTHTEEWEAALVPEAQDTFAAALAVAERLGQPTWGEAQVP